MKGKTKEQRRRIEMMISYLKYEDKSGEFRLTDLIENLFAGKCMRHRGVTLSETFGMYPVAGYNPYNKLRDATLYDDLEARHFIDILKWELTEEGIQSRNALLYYEEGEGKTKGQKQRIEMLVGYLKYADEERRFSLRVLLEEVLDFHAGFTTNTLSEGVGIHLDKEWRSPHSRLYRELDDGGLSPTQLIDILTWELNNG